MFRRWIWIAIALVIGAAALAMLGDVRQLAARLGGFRWPAFLAALGLALGNYMIRFARWTLYLRRQAVRVPPRASALVFGAGLSLSITPGKVGDLIKSYLLRELRGVPATRTAPIAGALSFLPGGLGVTEGAMAMWLVRGATRLDRSSAVDATLLTRLATGGSRSASGCSAWRSRGGGSGFE